MRSYLLLPLFAAACVTGGCGLRGPLYLPEDQAGMQTEAARPAGAPGAAATEDGKITTPQPAPQAQKRDRPAGTTGAAQPPAD